MATNTGSGYPKGALSGFTEVKDPKTGLWTKRDTKSGQFTTVKKTGHLQRHQAREVVSTRVRSTDQPHSLTYTPDIGHALASLGTNPEAVAVPGTCPPPLPSLA